jgi:hypothetical protein
VGEYLPAAICRRGHVISIDTTSKGASQRCSECGATVLTSCERCGHRIRGYYYVEGVIGWSSEYSPPSFCHECGSPYPWVGRTGRIYELENRLEEEELDPAEALALREDIEALIAADPDNEEEQKRLWQRIARRAPAVWEKSGARTITETLVTAAVRRSMGW